MSDPKPGIGNAPTRCTTLPTDSAARKTFPVASGFTDYFPDAIAAVSNLSYAANEQHHPGQPINWERSKSTDEADTLLRHFLERGSLDTDGKRHSAKLAWRALALLQKEIEAEQEEGTITMDEIISQHRAQLQAVHERVKNGPFCSACGCLAEVRSELTGTYFCRRCVNEDLGLYTVLDGGKQ